MFHIHGAQVLFFHFLHNFAFRLSFFSLSFVGSFATCRSSHSVRLFDCVSVATSSQWGYMRMSLLVHRIERWNEAMRKENKSGAMKSFRLHNNTICICCPLASAAAAHCMLVAVLSLFTYLFSSVNLSLAPANAWDGLMTQCRLTNWNAINWLHCE